MGGCKETVFKDAINEEKYVANLIKMQNNFEKKIYRNNNNETPLGLQNYTFLKYFWK